MLKIWITGVRNLAHSNILKVIFKYKNIIMLENNFNKKL